MAVTYFVRMVAEPDQADRVLELLLSNPRRIEAGEPGNVVFAVHLGIDDPNEFCVVHQCRSPNRRGCRD